MITLEYAIPNRINYRTMIHNTMLDEAVKGRRKMSSFTTYIFARLVFVSKVHSDAENIYICA